MKTLPLIPVLLLSIGDSAFILSKPNSFLRAAHLFYDYNPPNNQCPHDEFVQIDERVIPFPEVSFSMGNYFQNLYDYSPNNFENSCGYVSLAQYLSYYDSFYNDTIIPEQYERYDITCTTYNQCLQKSPGVLNQTYPSNYTSLSDLIDDNKEIDFQMQLMYIVNSFHQNDPDFAWSSSCGMWDYQPVLDYYFPNNSVIFSDTYYTNFANDISSSYAQSQLISLIEYQLDLGRPVVLHIVGLYNYQTQRYDGKHSLVAYYYDNDGIHCNAGWGSAYTDFVIPNASWPYIDAVGYANFESSLPEIHSDNYHFSLFSFCGCGAHFHNYVYSAINSFSHRKTCMCGINEIEPHIFDNEGVCIICDYVQ